MSTPYERARHFVEQIYLDFPECPICKQNDGYRFSGWVHDYIQCNSCEAKWVVNKSRMILVGSPKGQNSEFFQEMIGRVHSLDFWKKLKIGHSVIKCRDCGHENPSEFKYCGQCGVPLHEDETKIY